jgi:hypothetical protein
MIGNVFYKLFLVSTIVVALNEDGSFNSPIVLDDSTISVSFVSLIGSMHNLCMGRFNVVSFVCIVTTRNRLSLPGNVLIILPIHHFVGGKLSSIINTIWPICKFSCG